MSKYNIVGCVVTTEGNVRKQNEDNFFLFGEYRKDVSENKIKKSLSSGDECALAAVYDGMGGEEAGEIASLIAAETIRGCNIDSVSTSGLEQILHANEKICIETKKQEAKRLGTTMVAMYFDSGNAICGNIGDSRCYFKRAEKLSQLSKDHSEGQSLVDAGSMSEEEARNSKSWHRLTQHLGIFPEEFIIEPHYSDKIQLQEKDIFMLCSDGLTDVVTNGEIDVILGKKATIEEKAEELVKLALDKGSRDNITVEVLEVKSEKSMLNFKPLIIGAVSIILAIIIFGLGFWSGKSSVESINNDSVIANGLSSETVEDDLLQDEQNQ